jgi:hypothetical protein
MPTMFPMYLKAPKPDSMSQHGVLRQPMPQHTAVMARISGRQLTDRQRAEQERRDRFGRFGGR